MKAKHFTGTTIADLGDFFDVNPSNSTLNLTNYLVNQEIILRCTAPTVLSIVGKTLLNPRSSDTSSTLQFNVGDVVSVYNLSTGLLLFAVGLNNSVTTQGNTFNGPLQLTKTDSTGKLPSSVLPMQSVRNVVVLNDVVSMLAQTGLSVGDSTSVIADADTNKNGFYILTTLPESDINNWSRIVTPLTVASVNGQTGPNVVLDKTHIGLSNVQDVDQTDAANITSGTVDSDRLPVASSSDDGIINQISQSFSGEKTFLDGIIGDLEGNSSSSNSVISAATKNSHGLTSLDVGRPVTNTNGVWDFSLSISSSYSCSGLIHSIIDSDNFNVIHVGKFPLPDWTNVTGTTTLTSGDRYFVSDTSSGKLTSSEPTIQDEVMQFIDSTTAFVFIGKPSILSETSTSPALIPRFGSRPVNNAVGYIIMYGDSLFSVGMSSATHSYAPFAWQTSNYTLTIMPIINNGSAITGWSDVYYTYENAIALTTSGRVFEIGRRTSSISFKEIIFPENIIKIFGPKVRSSAYDQVSYFAISSTGKLYAWGDNTWGQLGINNYAYQANPILVSALSGVSVVDVSVSGNRGIHVAALDSSGQVYTWGYNTGPGSPIGAGIINSNIPSPYLVIGFNDVSKVVTGGDHDGSYSISFTRVLRQDGSSWATGNNYFGALAVGDTLGRSIFTKEVTNKTNIVDIGTLPVVRGASYIIDSSGVLYFSGSNWDLSLGISNSTTNNTSFSNSAQLSSAGFQGKMVQGSSSIKPKVILLGNGTDGWNTCAVLDNTGSLYTSGSNAHGQCATGDTSSNYISSFSKVRGIPSTRKVTDVIGVGYSGTGQGLVVILDDGTMMACGKTDYGCQGNTVYPTGHIIPRFQYVIGFEPK